MNKIPPNNETELRTAIKDNLILYEKQGKLVFIYNNSGAATTQNRFIRFGKSGSSDFLIWLPNKRSIFLEAKMPGKKQTNNQIEFQKKVQALGYEYVIINYISDLDRILKGE